MIWQKEGYIIAYTVSYEIFFVNFWVIILCPVFLTKNLKKIKNL